MAINRFYNPSRGQYVSQFVPDALPADLMVKGLAAKQQQYDTMADEILKLGDWEQKALKGYDTQYVKDWQGKVQDFRDSSIGQDLGSAEFARQYKQLLTDIKEDEGLKAVNQSYNLHQQYLERKKELMEGDPNAYDSAFVENYERHFAEYTKEGGLGYKGTTQLSSPSILEGVDTIAEIEKIYDQLKLDGEEDIQLLAQNIYYKNGWKGVTSDKVSAHTLNVLNQAMDSRVGQQLLARFDAQHIPQPYTYEEYITKMSPEQREEYVDKRNTYFKNELLSVGLGYTNMQTTTDLDQAYNKLYDRAYDAKVNNPQAPYIGVVGETRPLETKNYEDTMQDLSTTGEYIDATKNELGMYGEVLEDLRTGTFTENYKKGNYSAEDIVLIAKLPFAKEMMNGSMSEAQRNAAATAVQQHIEEGEFALHQAKTAYANDLDREQTAVSKLYEIDHPGYDMKGKLSLGKTIKDHPAGKALIEQYESMPDAEKKIPYGNQSIMWHSAQAAMKKAEQEGDMEALQAVKAFNVWADAKGKFNTTLESVHFHKTPGAHEGTYASETFNAVFDTIWEGTGSVQSNAVAINPQETYTPLDKNGLPGKPTLTNDHFLEEVANTNPKVMTVYLNGKIVKPGDPEYPNPGTIQFGSRDKSTWGENESFVYYGTGSTQGVHSQWGTDEGEGKGFAQQYTFVMNGVDTKSLHNNLTAEAESYVIGDDGYNPALPIEDQVGLTPVGQAWQLEYIKHNDPKMAIDIDNVARLSTPGESYTFSKTMVNPFQADRFGNAGVKSPVTINVKVPEDGKGFLVEITDLDNNNLLSDMQRVYAGSPAEVAQKIKSLEDSFATVGQVPDSNDSGVPSLTDKEGYQPTTPSGYLGYQSYLTKGKK